MSPAVGVGDLVVQVSGACAGVAYGADPGLIML